MSEKNFGAQTYTNPVYPRSFPDPFILKFCNEYFAYGTGIWTDGKVFGVLRSSDLVHWTEVGGAMDQLDHRPPFYWAPEVTYSNGKFYLYYSVGNETLMEIRVAVSDTPEGGFLDTGKRLTFQNFAIDAHVFTDTDGSRYMFYATDFLEHTHIGTGTVVDRMIDWFALEGKPRPVTRPRFDWQVYDPVRKEKGGVRWHTVEGPFVLKRKGIYYEMFSGGNWQNISYGVSFAVTDNMSGNEEWEQFSDGEKILPILRTVPGKVIGPGHNSIIRGPNNCELFCVYHRWIGNERVLAIDRMDLTGNRIYINGATDTPQPAPFEPAISGFAGGWEARGDWNISATDAVSNQDGENEIVCLDPGTRYLFEVSAMASRESNGRWGFYLDDDHGKTFNLSILPERREAIVSWSGNTKTLPLAGDFNSEVFHLLRVEVDGRFIRFSLDETMLQFERMLERSSTRLALTAGSARTTFSGFALTKGFEDLFDRPGSAEDHGWKRIQGDGSFQIEGSELIVQSAGEIFITKEEKHENYEFAVNIRSIEVPGGYECFGFILLGKNEKILQRFLVRRSEGIFYLDCDGNKNVLPDSFNPMNYHQFRFLKTGERIIMQLEDKKLLEIPVTDAPTEVAIFCENTIVALDMVRLTVL
jgi:GH43 family beta-xylosidase